jgi:hypothetical protein
MPNVRISDLPLATLPLVGATSFFEIQALEAGENVSRRVAAENLNVSVALPIGTNRQVLVNVGGGSTYVATSGVEINTVGDVILAHNTDGAGDFFLTVDALGANVRQFAVGANDNQFRFLEGDFIQVEQGHVGYDASNDLEIMNLTAAGNVILGLVGNTAALTLVAAGFVGVGTLFDFDNSAAATAQRIVGRNSEGGYAFETDGGNLEIQQTDNTGADVEGHATFFMDGGFEIRNNGSIILNSGEDRGVGVRGSSANNGDPTAGAAQDVRIRLDNFSGTRVAQLGFDDATTLLTLTNVVEGGLIELRGTQSPGGGASVGVRFDPDDDVKLFDINVEVARTLPVASGGFEVDNQATGVGFERVLTTADLGGGVTFPLDALDNEQIRFGTGQDALFFFDATDMQINLVDGVDLRILGGTAGAEQMLNLISNDTVQQFFNGVLRSATTSVGVDFFGQAVDLDNSAAATVAVFLSRNSNGGMHVGVDASGDLQIRQLAAIGTNEDIIIAATRNLEVAFFHNNVETARTNTLALGGFFVNNTLTGAGFERALTTSDLGGVSGFVTDVRSSNLTLADATQATALSVTLVTNSRYAVEAILVVTVNAADDFDWRWVEPIGSWDGNGIDVWTGDDNIGAWSEDTEVTRNTSGGVDILHIKGEFSTLGSAGDLELQGAKNADAGSDGTIFQGSWLRAQLLVSF